jgi:hypothetical protein
MSNRFQISCVNKQPRNDPYHRITHVGGKGATQWKLTVDEVIERIESGKEAFYVQQSPSHQVEVIVAKSRASNKYIRTTADRDEPDNLLSLPECP